MKQQPLSSSRWSSQPLSLSPPGCFSHLGRGRGRQERGRGEERGGGAGAEHCGGREGAWWSFRERVDGERERERKKKKCDSETAAALLQLLSSLSSSFFFDRATTTGEGGSQRGEAPGVESPATYKVGGGAKSSLFFHPCSFLPPCSLLLVWLFFHLFSFSFLSLRKLHPKKPKPPKREFPPHTQNKAEVVAPSSTRRREDSARILSLCVFERSKKKETFFFASAQKRKKKAHTPLCTSFPGFSSLSLFLSLSPRNDLKTKIMMGGASEF